MFSNEKFYCGHLRSLFISRFTYRNSGDIASVRGCRVAVFVKPELYDCAATMLFLATGFWPSATKFVRKVRGLRYGVTTAIIYNTMVGDVFDKFGFNFLRKCQNIYFPLIDGSDPRVDFLFCATSLANSTQSRYTLSVLPEFIPETDTLLGRNYNLLKSTCSSWSVKVTMTTSETPNKTKIEHFNTLRAWGFPAYFMV